MLQLRDFRKRKGELKRLLELHKVKIADEGGHKIGEEENGEVAKEASSPANEEEADSSDVEVVYAMESGNVTLHNSYYVT